MRKDRQFRPLPVPSVTLGGLFGEPGDDACMRQRLRGVVPAIDQFGLLFA